MTIDEMIAVLQAVKEGKLVQWRELESTKWNNTSLPMWDFTRNDYRIAPDAFEEWWEKQPIAKQRPGEHGDGSIRSFAGGTYELGVSSAREIWNAAIASTKGGAS